MKEHAEQNPEAGGSDNAGWTTIWTINVTV
jgi:hypothetical protein